MFGLNIGFTWVVQFLVPVYFSKGFKLHGNHGVPHSPIYHQHQAAPSDMAYAYRDFIPHSFQILVQRINKNHADTLKALEEFSELVTTLDSDPNCPMFNNQNMPNYIVQPDGSVIIAADGSLMNIDGFPRVGYGVAFGASSALNRGGTVTNLFPSAFSGELVGAKNALEIAYYNMLHNIQLAIDNDSARDIVQQLRDMTDPSVLDILFRKHPDMKALLKETAHYAKSIPKLKLVNIKAHSLSLSYVSALK